MSLRRNADLCGFHLQIPVLPVCSSGEGVAVAHLRLIPTHTLARAHTHLVHIGVLMQTLCHV